MARINQVVLDQLVACLENALHACLRLDGRCEYSNEATGANSVLLNQIRHRVMRAEAQLSMLTKTGFEPRSEERPSIIDAKSAVLRDVDSILEAVRDAGRPRGRPRLEIVGAMDSATKEGAPLPSNDGPDEAAQMQTLSHTDYHVVTRAGALIQTFADRRIAVAFARERIETFPGIRVVRFRREESRATVWSADHQPVQTIDAIRGRG